MEHDDICSVLIKTYYDTIYRYCCAVLHQDTEGAADCTQETFFLMFRKRAVLNLHGNMRIWLYKSADRVMHNYMRRERRYREQIPLDEVEIAAEDRIPGAETEELRAHLSQEEFSLLKTYYEAEHGDRDQISAKCGMTIQQLYKKIDRIKNRLNTTNRTKEK